jgi:hypothetical protein
MVLAYQVMDLIKFGGLNVKAGPGYPYNYVYTMNGKFIMEAGYEILLLVMIRLYDMWKYKDSIHEMSRRQLVDNNLTDYIRVFCKDEPHTQKKMENYAMRIINSHSIIDQIKDRVLYHHITKVNIANWYLCPSAPGIGFTDEMNKRTVEHVNEMLVKSKLEDDDSATWDWGVKPQEIEVYGKSVVNRSNASGTAFQVFVEVDCYVRARVILVTSDGIMMMALDIGQTRSGWFITSDFNSYAITFFNAWVSDENKDLKNFVSWAA